MTELPPSSFPPPPPPITPASPASPGSVKRIIFWNFIAALLIALLTAASQEMTPDAMMGLGMVYFALFPIVNVVLLLITAFRKSGTRSALLGYLLVALVMPLIGFCVCAAGLSGANF